MHFSDLYGLIPFFASALLALVCALTFKSGFKRYRRRSPLHGRKVGKLPGQGLVERVAHHDSELMMAILLMYLALPYAFLVWVGGKVDWTRVQWGVHESIFAVFGLLMFGYGLFDYVRHFRAREQARDGLLAERVTGMQLNRLVAKGCTVLHDLPGEGFNIDHVVIAPRGVYAVETKSFRKPRQVRFGENYRVAFDGQVLRFPDFIATDAVAQAQRQAQWLSKTLRESLGRDVPVVAALALPGWLIDQPDDVWHNAKVKVFSPMREGANFMAKDSLSVDADTRRLVKDALAVRYPDIAD